MGYLHIRRAKSHYFSCLTVIMPFGFSILVLSQTSTASSAIVVYMLTLFANGACTGAALNYTLSHVFFLTSSETHFLVSSLMSTFRGFGGGFGSAIGGGIFSRVLLSTLRKGFERKGLAGTDELIKKLLGSPALVAGLVGDDRVVAINGYVVALKSVLTLAGAFTLVTVLVQAGTGWTGPPEAEN